MIPQSFIQELLNRIDVVNVVGERVQLKKAGANFLGLCPFHSEKTPSFTVSPSKQFYHCFGCGRSGSAISFMMEYVGLSFVDAVEELAKQVGLTVPHERLSPERAAQEQQHKARQQSLSEVMSAATLFYKNKLRTSSRAIDYLKSRGLTGEMAARYALGYAPAENCALKEAFTDYTSSQLQEVGLVVDKSSYGEFSAKQHYDRFRDRIMFPIRNIRGQVIGFGGRVLEKAEPKYLNSPETILFQKGNELYGLFEAKQAIRDAGYALVVEGYMDVLALAQWGFAQSVATLGTACTHMHVQKLFRHTDKIVFSFDGDKAGRSAARRALEATLPVINDKKFVSFLFLPAEHDPDSYVRTYGTEAFEKMVREAKPLSEFLIEQIIGGRDLRQLESRAQAQADAVPLLKNMPTCALKTQIVRVLAQKLEMPANELAEFVGMAEKRLFKQQRARAVRAPVVGLERQVLRVLLLYPKMSAVLSEDDVASVMAYAPDKGELFQTVYEAAMRLGDAATYAGLVEQLRMSAIDCEQLVAETVEQDFDEVGALLQAQGAIRQMKTQLLAKEMEQLFASKLPPEEMKKRYEELLNQQKALKKAQSEELAQASNM